MPNFANATLAGHLGKDPETRPAGNTTVTSFSLAVNTGFGDRKVTTWWNVSIFGKRGETAAQHLHKGDAVIVSGEPQMRKYQKNDGSEGVSLDINANNWSFAGGKGDEQTKPQSQQEPPPFNDDCPF